MSAFKLKIKSDSSSYFSLYVKIGTVNFDIDWGDGNIETYLTTGSGINHTYPLANTEYIISMTENEVGKFPGINVNNLPKKTQYLEIMQWGTNQWTSLDNAFRGCSNLIITATDGDTTDFSQITSLSNSFLNCTSLTSFPHLNFSNVTSFYSTWMNTGLTTFSCDISSGTDFTDTFNGTPLVSFSGDLSKAEGITGIFSGCPLSVGSYSNILNNLVTNLNYSLVLDVGSTMYNSSATSSREYLLDPMGYEINDGGLSEDSLSPTWTSTYPKINSKTTTTAQFVANINENGLIYCVIVPKNASAPSSIQVRDSKNASGNYVAYGFYDVIVSLSASVDGYIDVLNLSPNTEYDAYIVAEDSAGGWLQTSPTKIQFQTEGESNPTCWSFFAKYKKSNKMFQMNGPYDAPETFIVPKNIDINTAVLIEHGIKKNNFKIIQ
jgi:hypothetical protein